MKRRDFLRATALSAVSVGRTFAEAARWRTFEVTTRTEILNPDGVTRVWAPAPLDRDTPWQRTLSVFVDIHGGVAKTVKAGTDGPAMVVAEFPAGVPPILKVTSRVRTRDWSVDLSVPNSAAKPDDLQRFLRPTKFIPTGGIVKERSTEITRSASTDLDKARAIYEWIIESTRRNPKTRGCGLGNIEFMLESGDLSGKCADLNSLYVGLARAAGLPARDVFGIRVAKSELGYKSLGASSENITKAQHCRAEVYLTDYGWVPVDPAGVRKVMLEEPPGNRPLSDEMVRQARARLFGSWEMNWMAYNFAHDVTLPGSSGPPVPFFMYPQAETAAGRLDSLAPDTFKYEISARELETA